jgi:hypothetical protein
MNLLNIAVGVDNIDAPRLCCRQFQKSLTHPVVKGDILLFDTILVSPAG